MATWDDIGEQLQRVAAGETDAWAALLTALGPELERIAKRQPVGRLRQDEDAQRDIVTKVIGKLHRDEHKLIKKFVGQEDPPPLQAWIRVLVRSSAIDVMRGRPEFVRGNDERPPGWLSLATLVTRDGAIAPSSLELKQREVENFLAEAISQARDAIKLHGDDAAGQLATAWKVAPLHARRLVKRVDHYPRILQMVLAGHSYVEVAKALELSRREVELIVGYIEELFWARGFAA